MIEKTAKVWLGGRRGVTAPIHVSQYDTGWRFLLSVYDGDAVYTGGESTAVYMEGRKADGTVFAVPGAFADGVAVVECTASITAAVGPIDCELRVSEDGETVGTANFEIIVEAAPLKGYVASGDDFSAMQQVLDGSSDAAADALAAKNAAAASAEAAAVSAATAQVQAGMAYQIAASAADMTDHSIGYVYVGNETGYTYGGWYYWDGTAWTLGGLSVDPTLTVAGAAADAKAAGDEIGDLRSALLLDGAKAQTIPNGTDYDSLLTPGNYVCQSGASAGTMIHCPTTLAHRLTVLKTVSAERIVQSVIVNGSKADEYKRFYTGSAWGEWVKIAITSEIPTVDKTLLISGAAADAKVTGQMKSALVGYADYQMTATGLLPLLWFRGTLAADGTVNADFDSSYSVTTEYIPIIPGSTFAYKKDESVNVIRIVEYASDRSVLSSTTLRAANNSYTLGENTEYIRLGYVKSNSYAEPITPEYAYKNFYAYLPNKTNTDNVIPLGLHTMPDNEGVLNCIKRARQMTDITWSVATNIDRVNIISGQRYDDPHLYFQNQFAANREYTGLPYSEQNFIGCRKGITQFVTSAANENSRECTQSQYTGDHNTASHFGTVCVTLVSYALHAPQISSPNYTNLVGLTKLYDLYNNGTYHSIDDLKLCDVLWEHGHVAIVTDIIHDEFGHVEWVEVSESTKFGSYLIDNGNGDFGGKCRRKLWAKDEFLQWFSSFAVYRYDAGFLAAIPYVPNKFVPMVDETPYADDPNLPCVPIDGDHAYYFLSTASQRNVTVLIRGTGYTHMRIKQNGENYGALIDITGLTEVTVSCDTSTEAVYEAYLCTVNDETERYTSKSCYWVELGATATPTMQANQDGSYTFSLIRSTNVAYPFVVIYNGTAVNTGNYTPITACDVTKVSNGYRYTFTVTPPSGITINSFFLLFDAGEYGWFPTSNITPS